jgi:pimeloyl-ACP methyl ester carboxylesterase
MLARNYTVIAPDLLGHGQSDKPRTDYSVAAYANGIRDLLKMLKIERVTAVGHSLGGGVAMQFAYQYAAQCERLVLISSGGVCADVNQLLRLAAAPSSELVLPLVTWVGTRTLTRWFCKLMKRLDADIGLDADDLMRVLDALPNPASQRAFLRTLRSVVDWRGQAVTMLDRCYLARRMPTLLVWGSRDAVIPASHAQIARLAMPGSKLEMFEGAGHFPFRSDPERFVSALDRFVRHTEPSRYCDDEWREMLLDGPPERKPVTRPVPTKCLRADTCGAWCADLPNQEAQCPKPTANVLVDLRVSKLATVRAHDQCSNS